jgi:hypothetical protein
MRQPESHDWWNRSRITFSAAQLNKLELFKISKQKKSKAARAQNRLIGVVIRLRSQTRPLPRAAHWDNLANPRYQYMQGVRSGGPTASQDNRLIRVTPRLRTQTRLLTRAAHWNKLTNVHNKNIRDKPSGGPTASQEIPNWSVAIGSTQSTEKSA